MPPGLASFISYSKSGHSYSVNRTQAFPVYQGKILHDGIFFPFFHQVDTEMTIIKLPKDYESIKLMIVLPKDYESIKLMIVLSFSPWYHEAFL